MQTCGEISKKRCAFGMLTPKDTNKHFLKLPKKTVCRIKNRVVLHFGLILARSLHKKQPRLLNILDVYKFNFIFDKILKTRLCEN
ncbi:MAG: hypothetical protein D6707_00450 [Bacteroidetes bacterium]|nr:MAG: hypothetical protein D6707_00450 [Bacteroidota bacterium]